MIGNDHQRGTCKRGVRLTLLPPGSILASVKVGQASLVAQTVKTPPAIKETWVRSLGREDPLEEGMTTHSSILAWRPMDRGAWWVTVHGVTNRRDWHIHRRIHTHAHIPAQGCRVRTCISTRLQMIPVHINTWEASSLITDWVGWWRLCIFSHTCMSKLL